VHKLVRAVLTHQLMRMLIEIPPSQIKFSCFGLCAFVHVYRGKAVYIWIFPYLTKAGLTLGVVVAVVVVDPLFLSLFLALDYPIFSSGRA